MDIQPHNYTELFNLAIAKLKTEDMFQDEHYLPITETLINLFRHTRSMVTEIPDESDFSDIYREQIATAEAIING